jgi:thioredoxin 1
MEIRCFIQVINNGEKFPDVLLSFFLVIFAAFNFHSLIMAKFQELINSNIPVMVDFYADWCGPCQTMGPILKEVASNTEGKAKIIKVNIDRNEAAAQSFGVRSVPTFIIFKNGQQVWRHSGTIDRSNLERTLLSFS